MTFHVPNTWGAEEDSSTCAHWLGIQDGIVQRTMIRHRVSFALEDLREDGSFHLAA